MSQDLFIYEKMIQGMKEGVLAIDKKGKILNINPAAKEILGLKEENLTESIAPILLEDERNLEFVQLILDAVYERGVTHNAVVSFFDGESQKQLFVSTSYLQKEEEKIGILVALNDVTELMELRDAMQAMNKIRKLNHKLEVRNQFIKDMFGKYLSDDIVEQILDKGKNQIGGTKRELTILFTDLRGFTAISETMEAEALLQMLNHYLSEMIEIIRRWNGTILEFIGDAIVVVFGAPAELKKETEAAVSCAVEMQNAMQKINQYNEEKGFLPLTMSIGIHRGIVVVGNIGSEQKMKYDVIGKNVNLASRIESYAVGGQILISDPVRKEVRDLVKTGEKKKIHPKGIQESIPVYEVLSMNGIENRQAVCREQIQFHMLERPFVLEGSIIDGKMIDSEKITVTVTHTAGNYIRCRTDCQMELYQDIKFYHSGHEFYVKVEEKRYLQREKDYEYILCITAGKLEDIENGRR